MSSKLDGIEVFVADEQADHPVEVTRWSRLAAEVLAAQGVRGDAELSLLFVDEPSMAELNLRFMGEEGPTDVLAFPIDDDVVTQSARNADPTGPGPAPEVEPSDAPALVGDVVLCPAVAARNASGHAGDGHRGTFEDEVALLVVHGVLHLLGMDHAEEAEARAMRAREQELLGRFHRP